jgi:hypothetical protein
MSKKTLKAVIVVALLAVVLATSAPPLATVQPALAGECGTTAS